jgi:hypothetical protein
MNSRLRLRLPCPLLHISSPRLMNDKEEVESDWLIDNPPVQCEAGYWVSLS